jgi:hypothetical protein
MRGVSLLLLSALCGAVWACAKNETEQGTAPLPSSTSTQVATGSAEQHAAPTATQESSPSGGASGALDPAQGASAGSGGSAALGTAGAPLVPPVPARQNKAPPRAASPAPTAGGRKPPTPPAGGDKSKLYTGDKPCRSTDFHFASVRKVCEEQGQRGAKAMMKSLVKKAKAQGTSFKCSTCHDSTKTYTNKPDAVKKLRPWL